MSKEYSLDLQKLFLEMMLADSQSFVRVQNIYNFENFDRSLRSAAKFVKEHSEQYKTLPTVEQVQAMSGTTLTVPQGLNQDHYDWFLDEFEGFSRRNELERAILKAAEYLEKGDYDPVEQLIKDAVQISLTRDMGTDYFLDPIARLRRIKDNNGQVSTGWVNLDRLLYGGFNRGELNIFAGGSGSGKSLFMQNISVNWVTQGLNGVYITLELSEELCAMRIDSMMTNCSTKDVFRDMETVEMKVKMAAKKSGHFRIKYMPAQSTVNDIRAYLKELQIQLGLKLDFVMVDYLDLLMPVSAKVSPSDLFVKDKYVSEELRNLAKEFHILFVTASQLNRAAVEEVEFDHSHISGGISKINTADNVFGIFTSRAMRERGKYNLQCMKTRSSSGVGQKVELDFDVDSLRITGIEDEDQTSFKGGPNSAKSIMGRLQKGNGGETIDPTTGEIQKNVKAEVNSNKLKNMLNNLRTGDSQTG